MYIFGSIIRAVQKAAQGDCERQGERFKGKEPDNPYELYEHVRVSLSEGPIDDRLPEVLQAIMPNNHGNQAARLAKRLVKNPEDEALRHQIYSSFTRSPSSEDVLVSWLIANFKETEDRARKSPENLGPIYAWRNAYLLETALTSYQRTQKIEFLNLARDSMLKVAATRDDKLGLRDKFRDRIMPTWGTTSGLKEASDTYGRLSIVTHAGRIATNMARYAYLVRSNPNSFEDQPHHRDAATLLLETAKAAILAFEDDFVVSDDGESGTYWRPYMQCWEALNHVTSVGEAILYIAKLTQEEFWIERANMMARHAQKVQLRGENGLIYWKYKATVADPHDGPIELIRKAQITIKFLVLAEQLGFVFTRADLKEVAATIRSNVLLDGEAKSSAFVNSIIEETYKPFGELKEKQRTGSRAPQNLISFYSLSEYDPLLGEQITDLVANDMSLGGWLATPGTAHTYAARLECSTKIDG